jgi:hypothetical protein
VRYLPLQDYCSGGAGLIQLKNGKSTCLFVAHRNSKLWYSIQPNGTSTKYLNDMVTELRAPLELVSKKARLGIVNLLYFLHLKSQSKHQTSNEIFINSTYQYSHIISFHPFQRPLPTAKSYFVPRLLVLPTKFK